MIARIALAAFLILAATVTSAQAQGADVDRQFVLAAMQGNNAELDMAQLAQRRGGIPEVQHYAAQMLDEHTKLGQRLVDTAGPLLPHGGPRLAIPDALAYTRLSGLPAPDFDQQYLLAQIGDHLATISVFQTEAMYGQNLQLKQFAQAALPMLQAHLELAVNQVRHVGGDTPFSQHG